MARWVRIDDEFVNLDNMVSISTTITADDVYVITLTSLLVGKGFSKWYRVRFDTQEEAEKWLVDNGVMNEVPKE